PVENSPPRFHIPLEMIQLIKNTPEMSYRTLPPFRVLPSLLGNLKKAVKSLPDNPTKPLSEASPEFLDELLEYARSVGVDIIGLQNCKERRYSKNREYYMRTPLYLPRKWTGIK
ncbi:MAG: hypothetical protein RTU92_13295, partial [Candidatus Thorarchaeota archaeon]